jgi:hypothetical protein
MTVSKLTVCVDLDGVLAHYDGWKGEACIGAPLPGAKEFVAALREKYRVVLFTTRCKADPFGDGEHRSVSKAVTVINAWLEKHGIEVDEIYHGQGKPMAAAYVDDRAVGVPSNPGAEDLVNAVKVVDAMIERLAPL